MTPLMASGSNLIFQGNNTFRNNSLASNGAGIKLNNTNLTFANNHARERGGAIYVHQTPSVYFSIHKRSSLLHAFCEQNSWNSWFFSVLDNTAFVLYAANAYGTTTFS